MQKIEPMAIKWTIRDRKMVNNFTRRKIRPKDSSEIQHCREVINQSGKYSINPLKRFSNWKKQYEFNMVKLQEWFNNYFEQTKP